MPRRFAWTRYAVLSVVVAMLICGCNDGGDTGSGVTIPMPDLTGMEPQVAERLVELRQRIEGNPRSADAWGRFGMVLHAHELFDEAIPAYSRARELDPEDERWPYYHGEALSIVGADLDAAEAAFRRFMGLRSDYGAAHMRLGKVLIAVGRSDEAATELERALVLDPGLQPARVALGQVRLAEGELDEAARLLEEVIAASPRHEQALTTLGQVYMRQGRRDEAREVAERAASAAAYNLYADPLMSQVVAEELSSVQIWERAKAFLDNGNYEQAAIGLSRVVEWTPDNADAHLQLAVALGHLGRPARAVEHLERSVALQPDSADARTRLGALYLEVDRPQQAADQLREAVALGGDEPDVHWMLARALLRSGLASEAIAAFEAVTADGSEPPVDARVDWGNALAQLGRASEALSRFDEALAQEPDNPQALFFAGLVHEGRRDPDRAIALYCRSLIADPDSPARQRLDILGRACD